MQNLGTWKMQIRKLKEKRTNFIKQYIKIAEELSLINKKISALNKKIQQWNKSDFHLSEHFILRFKERVKEVDIPTIKELVFTQRNIHVWDILQEGIFPIDIDGTEYKVIIKNKILITILDK